MITKHILGYRMLGDKKPYKTVTTYKFLGILFYKIIRVTY